VGKLTFSIYNPRFSQLPKAFDGFTIAHISDLHNKRFGLGQQYLCSVISGLDPDIIVFTGDIIHHGKDAESRLNKVRPFLKRAVKVAPVYYVTGNHEIESKKSGYIWNAVRDCGARVLINEREVIKRGGAEISLLGMADPFFFGRRHSYAALEKEMKRLCNDTKGYNIALCHRPEIFDAYIRCGINLALTGHAHGGQFQIPLIGGVYTPDQGMFPKYSQGSHKKGETEMIVNRGLGNSGFPQRLFNRPEVGFITLTNH